MSQLLIHKMEMVWMSSDQSLFEASPDDLNFVEGKGCNRLAATDAAGGATVSYTPASPLNLSGFDELRFWVRGSRRADGSAASPFYLEFSFTDADAPAEEHRWFVPVNRVGVWEQRRLGIEKDSRGAVDKFTFKCLTDFSFVCLVDELLAVREEMMADIEQALTAQLDGRLLLPGLSSVPLGKTALPNDAQIVLPYTPAFTAGNRVVVRGGSKGDETHDVNAVTHDRAAGTTALVFGDEDKVRGTLDAGAASASVVVPLLFETPPAHSQKPSPAIIATLVDMREDNERTSYFTQRDNFRPRGSETVYSTRPSARAYLFDYQLAPLAAERAHYLLIYTLLLQRLSADVALRINGAPSPVWLLPTPPIQERDPDRPGPLFVRIGTRMETAARTEVEGVKMISVTTDTQDAATGRGGPTP